MNTNVIIGLVAGVVVVGGGAYVYTQSNATASLAQESATTTQDVSAMGSIKDLMARGSSECTVSNTVANSESSGTVYVGDGKMRGDFTSVTTNPAMTIESHMISDGEFMYSWSSAMPQGVKMAVADVNSTGQPNAPESNQVAMYNAQVNYDCDSWRVDSTKFELPKGVEFMDMQAMTGDAMKTLPKAGGNVKGTADIAVPGAAVQGSAGAGVNANAQMCAACDMAPADQKAQCRAALNCK